MTREELTSEIAKAEGISEEAVDAVVGQLLDLITRRMADQEETSIYGFGKFGIRWWKGRSGRDPQNGEKIEIEGRWMPYWTPSNTLIKAGEPHPIVQESTHTEGEYSVEKTEPEENEEVESEITPSRKDESEFEQPDVSGKMEPDEEPVPEFETSEQKSQPAPPQEPPLWESENYMPGMPNQSTFRKLLLSVVAVIAVIILVVLGTTFLGDNTSDITFEGNENQAEPPATDEPLTAQRQSPSAAMDSELGTTATDGEMLVESSPATESTAVRSANSEEQEQFFQDYQTALDQFRDHNYVDAKQGFENLLTSRIPLDYGDNVEYWLGETEFALGEYDKAIHAFGKVFSYPGTNKMEDAVLMMAYAYRQLGEYDQAHLLLIKFRHQFADSRYAPVANRWLRNDSLKIDSNK